MIFSGLFKLKYVSTVASKIAATFSLTFVQLYKAGARADEEKTNHHVR
jgi:hypothetical protein